MTILEIRQRAAVGRFSLEAATGRGMMREGMAVEHGFQYREGGGLHDRWGRWKTFPPTKPLSHEYRSETSKKRGPGRTRRCSRPGPLTVLRSTMSLGGPGG